ncbi:MAG TPA: AI-2E family transporter [Terriglobales bacterium]|nr:AI-2E family transporter [Terriglobales bacterium]
MAHESSPLKAPPTQPNSPSHQWTAATQVTSVRLGEGQRATANMDEEEEILHASIKAGSVAQIVVAVIAVVGLIYVLKIVLVTILSAMLLAFAVEPLVKQLHRGHVPRALGALLTVLLMVALAIGMIHFFYSRAVDFATELPKYSGKIHSAIAGFRAQTEKIEESAGSVIASPRLDKHPIAVEIHESPGLSRIISAGSGTLGDVLLAISFVPFLVYFMLTWKDHAHANTVRLFPKEHRLAAHRTVARISEMIRRFIAGSFALGLANAVISSIVFWRLGIPYFYFLGAISGFLSLIPYLGVVLALLPPLAAGIGILDKTGVLTIFLTVVGLHIVATNVVFPKIVGKRLQLNPLAVTLALLFWAWVWGAMGLILAVPLVAMTKIICDYIDSLRGFGAWLGD